MVGAKQQETRDFILVTAGAVRPAVACSRHYIALHRSAYSGAATSKAGEEARPPSPRWSDRSEFRCYGRIEERVCVAVSDVRVCISPAAWGFTFLLWTKERVNYRHAALFSYMGEYGVQRRGVGGRLDGPCHDLVIMACPVPEQWQLRG
jgi:hypothetical protein